MNISLSSSPIKRTVCALACLLLLGVTDALITDALASSNPIPGVGIVVKRNPGSSTSRTKTDKEGNFKFDKLEPGTYTLEVQSDDLAKSMAKLESRPPARAGHAMASTGSSTGKRTSTDAPAAGIDASGTDASGTDASSADASSTQLTPEISLSLDVQATNAGATSTIRQFSWTQVSGPVTFTVGTDGILEGQLRAGISTSRSNIRSK